jgi:purine-binding chemotaxis protein CheW
VAEPGGDVTAVLRERARQLARPVDEASQPSESIEALVFALGGAHYALAVGAVAEVLPLRGLTPLPGVPAFLPGVVNHRGRVLAVLDLRRLWDPAAEPVPGGHVVVLAADDAALGLLAESVAGVVAIGLHEIGPPPAAIGSSAQPFVQGVTAGMVTVLDSRRLAHDARIAVYEEARGRLRA